MASMGRTNWRQQPQKTWEFQLCHHPVTSGAAPGTHRHPSRSHRAVPPKLIGKVGARGLRTNQEVMGKAWLSAGGGALVELENHPSPGISNLQWKQPPAHLIHQLQLGLPLIGKLGMENGARRNPFWHEQGKELVTPRFLTLFHYPHHVHGGASCTSWVSPGKKRCFQSRVSSSSPKWVGNWTNREFI